MISLEEALTRVLASVEPLGSETVSLSTAHGRVLAEEARSPLDLPVFDNSAMDGYAVRSDDLRRASQESPVELRIIGTVAAGETCGSEVEQGKCARIFTGSALPAGADAVVMQEDVTRQGEVVRFMEPVKPFENVRLRGEDLRKGLSIGRTGDLLSPTRAAVFAATGFASFAVFRRPVVALLATGSELREPGEPLRGSEIYESNRTLLNGLLTQTGCQVRLYSLVPDRLAETESALRRGFDEADAVITTGGVSVGELDFVKEAFRRIGGDIDLWRVAIRPGKPFVFGKLGARRLFGLPGNPVSALVTFLLLVRPALLKMAGRAELELPLVWGKLTEAVQNRGDRRHFLRVRWSDGKVTVCGPQASHMISSLVDANGLCDLPPGARLEAGEEVQVRLWAQTSA